MKTFSEAVATLVQPSPDGGIGLVHTDAMDSFEDIGLEIVDAEETRRIAQECILGIVDGTVNLEQALRYAFCQGVVTGIEMEKQN